MPKNKDISKWVIPTLTRHIRTVNTITFTGGEPNRNPKAIHQYNKYLASDTQNWYIVTNSATRYTHSFTKALYDLHNRCNDNEISSLDVSTDMFHKPFQNIGYYHELIERFEHDERYYCPDFPTHERREVNYSNLITEGRSAHFKGRPVLPGVIFYDKQDDDLHIIEGLIYITVRGDIILGACDYSYESQKEHIVGNIKTHDLQEIIIEYGEEREDD